MILNSIEVDILASTKLIDLYNHVYPENFFIHQNVIYCIHNDINRKIYIGQTAEFTNRFSHSYVGHFRDYELYLSGNEKKKRALYNSWKKYGLEAFTVYIIEICDSRESLDTREMYWIKTLHTCTKDSECFGYNLTWGADDMGFLTEGAIKKSLQVRFEKYGNYTSPSCHTPEALEKGNKTKEKRYGHGGFVNAFTPEANEKRRQTKFERYGNYGGFQRDKFLKFQEENHRKYGDPRGNPESYERGRVNRRVTLCFQKIEKVLSLKGNISTLEEYFNLITKSYDTKDPRHHSRVLKEQLSHINDLFPLLKQDKRWRPELELIFGDSQEELKNKIDYLLEKRKREIKKQSSIKQELSISARKILTAINKNFKITDDLTWDDYKKLVFKRYTNKRKYEAKIHLNRIIDILPVMKTLPEWTSDHERIFGGLTDKDKL